VTWQDALTVCDTRQDGFGLRHFEQDDNWGRVELLDLAPALSTASAEQAIRARAARFMTGRVPIVAPLYSIARADDGVSIVSGAPDGVTLADLLGGLEFGTITLNDGAILELIAMTLRAVASMHEAGTFAHAALTPGHILLRPDGTVLLTGAVFGDALQALQRNREQLWREFGVALPPSATIPRFDHRSDVTQLGAVVLAILLRRALTTDEYPRSVFELVNTATSDMSVGPVCSSALRQWLQQTLQLQAKALFASAVDAERSFGAIVQDVSGRRTGADLIHRAVHQLIGRAAIVDAPPPVRPARVEPAAPAEEHSSPDDAALPAATSADSADTRARRRGFGFLRGVLPNRRAN
jgi:hypothetical protein